MLEKENIDPFLRDAIYEHPLFLLNLKDYQKANEFLPFSTGFEIECNYGKKYNVENFKKIPCIMNVYNDSNEQRYRIPNGVNGLLCLFIISLQLKLNSDLNPLSGIHYHIGIEDIWDKRDLLDTDCTFDGQREERFKTFSWIFDELETWGYKNQYNRRGISSEGGHYWLRGNTSFRTIECRIGEMTFDYDLLVKRIIHLNSIVLRLKEQLGVIPNIKYAPVQIEKFRNYFVNNVLFQEDLKYINFRESYLKTQVQSKSPTSIINNRVIKL